MSHGGTFATLSDGLTTLPPSSWVTTLFGGIEDGVAKQNTLGYDIILNISVKSSIAVGATFMLGVGQMNPPSTDPVTPSFTNITSNTFSFTAYVPKDYWLLVHHTGSVGFISIVVQGMAV